MLRKLLYFWNRRQKLQAAGLFCMMLVGAGFEAMGVALVFPLLTLLSSPDTLPDHAAVRWLYSVSGLTSPRAFLTACAIGMALLFLTKTLYLSLLYYLQYRFIFHSQASLSRRLVAAYLRAPYPFYLQRNSAELQRNANVEVLLIFTQVLSSLTQTTIEGLVVLVVAGMLVALQPVSALIATAALGGVSAAILLSVRTKTLAAGKSQQHHQGMMIQWVNEGLGSIKEARVLGRESYFLEQYARSVRGYSDALAFRRTMGELPRVIIEGVVIGGSLCLLLVVLIRGQNLQGILPLVGLFGMGAVRLMPSVSRIVSSVNAIRHFTPSVEAVYRDLSLLERSREAGESAAQGARPAEMPFNRAIELRGVSFRYEGAQTDALKEVSLTIPRGASVAFVGSSGAGKTTIVDVILGLLKPTSGEILIDEQEIHQNLRGWQRQVGYIPQPIYLLDDTIRRNVAFGVPDEEIDDEQVCKALDAAHLGEFVRALPEGYQTMVGEHGMRISGGQRQRIGIARALYHNPEVLVLDEATSALDNETEAEITRAIANLSREKTVLIIAHRLSTVRDCDCLFFLKNGVLTGSGSYQQLLAEHPEFRSMVTAATTSSQCLRPEVEAPRGAASAEDALPLPSPARFCR